MRATELKARDQQLDQANSKTGALNDQLRSQKARTDKMVREVNVSRDRLSKAENELREQVALNQSRLADTNAAQIELYARLAFSSLLPTPCVLTPLSFMLLRCIARVLQAQDRQRGCPALPRSHACNQKQGRHAEEAEEH